MILKEKEVKMATIVEEDEKSAPDKRRRQQMEIEADDVVGAADDLILSDRGPEMSEFL